MFHPGRQRALRNIEWRPGKVVCIEAWKYDNSNVTDPSNYRLQELHDGQVEEWLSQTGDYAPPQPGVVLYGGIRLVACEQWAFDPITFPLSQQTFLAIEEKFHLSPATLPSFDDSGYVHSWSIKGSDRMLFLVVKFPQKNPIANYALSLTHDVETGMTNALLYGSRLIRGSIRGTSGEHAYEAQLPQICAQIEATVTLWAHPLLLPVVLLSNHNSRTRQFCSDELESKLLEIEDTLGVTHSGRLTRKPRTSRDYIVGQMPIHETKSNMRGLTTEINSAMTEILLSLGVPAFQVSFAESLLRLLEEVRNHLPPDSDWMTTEFEEMLRYLASAAANNMEFLQQLRSRAEVQLNVLYNFMAQTDNLLSARLAASATRDSTAMKTLALLTALFLPPTFIATLFSMSMFDWQASDSFTQSTGDETVSSRFWIYWAVSAPLTVVIMGAWRLWWESEKKRYKMEYEAVLEQINKPMAARDIVREKAAITGGRHNEEKLVHSKGLFWRGSSGHKRDTV